MPSWFSQPIPALGAIKGEGIRNQLGRPDLDALTILVREAAQNSWDAALEPGTVPVRFSMDLQRLTGDRRTAWIDLLGAEAPRRDELPLLAQLDDPDLRILVVSDRGTRGLGGATRADRVTPDAAHDYVSFVLNVGDPRDQHLGGGTYGFGKAVFFNGSSAWTVLVHTRCRLDDGSLETRLVGIALGAGFTRDGRQFTGRHWWGVHSADAVVEPLVGNEADALAETLGLPSFDGEETGTTIAVVAPSVGDRTPREAMEWVAAAIQWHLWPKMIASANGPAPMEFAVSEDGEPLSIGSPETHPVLRQFVGVHQRLDQGATSTYRRQAIGRINLESTFAPPPPIDAVGSELGFDHGVRHTCLLRGPQLVVRYQAGPPMPDSRVWYAGVFLADEAWDNAFAIAEPPTHDAWSFRQLDGTSKGVVRRALEDVATAMAAHAAPAVTTEPTSEDHIGGLAEISRSLGSLLAPALGDAAGPNRPRGGGGPSHSPVSLVGTPRWESESGQDVLVQAFDVTASRRVVLESALGIVLWGGGSRAPEEPQPRVLGWRSPDGDVLRDERIAIEPAETGRWELIVTPVPETVTDIKIRRAQLDEHG
jgi:hypothetical protein